MTTAPSPQHTAPTMLWPRAAASAAIFRGDRILIAERGGGPRKGYWSLPGGKIEPGETAASAAAREIMEETGLQVDLRGILDVHDVIQTDDDGQIQHHFVICVYYGTCGPGEPCAATDISDARFVTLDELPAYQLTGGASRLIHEAYRRLVAADIASDGAEK